MNIKTFLSDQNQYNSKLNIISAIHHQWNIKEIKQAGVSKAWLLNWKPVYFIQQFNQVDMTVKYKDNIYQVKLHGCSIEDINKASKVALSFRDCNELGLMVCLVKFIY